MFETEDYSNWWRKLHHWRVNIYKYVIMKSCPLCQNSNTCWRNYYYQIPNESLSLKTPKLISINKQFALVFLCGADLMLIGGTAKGRERALQCPISDERSEKKTKTNMAGFSGIFFRSCSLTLKVLRILNYCEYIVWHYVYVNLPACRQRLDRRPWAPI